MLFLYDNAVTLSVAAVCCTFAWVFGGTIPSALMPAVPWLLAFMLEMALCFPQRHSGESTPEARERVWSGMKRDPMTWIVAVFLLLLLVPFFNKGLCPCCDYPAINFDGFSEKPPVPYAPFCVNRMEHLTVCVWFFPTLIGAVVVRHALLKRGKRMLLEMVVWNGAALGVLGIVQHLSGAKAPLWCESVCRPPYFFSTFGYPNMAADYFTTLFGLAVAVWRWKVFSVEESLDEGEGEAQAKANRKIFWSKHMLLIPAALFFFCAMMTLSRAAILFTSVLAVLFFVHAFASFVAKMPPSRRVKAVAATLLVLVLISTFFVVFLSNHDKIVAKSGAASADIRAEFRKEASQIGGRGLFDRAAGVGSSTVQLAVRVWLDNPLFGCGGWGYRHFSIVKRSNAEFNAAFSRGAANVHNDYLQFLAEHGAVGFALLGTVFLMLLWPTFRVWRAIVASVRFMKPKDQPPKPVAVFALPASAFCILLTTLATMVHAFGDCPLRSPAVLSLFFVSLACVDGFLPRLRTSR